MKREKFFQLFLIVYVGFLVLHSRTLPWNSLIVPLSVSAGFAVAVLAHTRYGVLTIGLLLVHIGLEWMEYARHGWHFSMGEIVFHGIHVCLDCVFLYQEFKMHIKRFRGLAFASVVVGIGIVFFSNYQSPPQQPFARFFNTGGHTCNHGDNPIEPFVLGGMFGCIIYHLNNTRTKKAGCETNDSKQWVK